MSNPSHLPAGARAGARQDTTLSIRVPDKDARNLAFPSGTPVQRRCAGVQDVIIGRRRGVNAANWVKLSGVDRVIRAQSGENCLGFVTKLPQSKGASSSNLLLVRGGVETG